VLDVDMNLFESLGANCEFGFVLSRVGIRTPSLFRWSIVPYVKQLIRLLNTDFAGMFSYENLAPFHPGMVVDRHYRIAWHSPMTSEKIDPSKDARTGNLRFVMPQAELEAVFRFEAAKVGKQVDRLRESLSKADRIFVYKAMDEQPVANEDIHDLFVALNKLGPNRLLVVSIGTPEAPAGSTELLAPRLVHGRLDRFAPGDKANDISLDCWLKLCADASVLLRAETTPA
jgi:hypothetical protein